MPRQVATTGAGTDVPDAAAVIVGLLNSRAYAVFPDRLESPRGSAEVLSEMGIEQPRLTPKTRQQLRTVRDALAAALLDPSSADRAWAAVSRAVDEVTFTYDFGSGRPVVSQSAGSAPLGRVTTALAELLSSGRWERIRLCANHDCEVAFYDTTRSRTQRWHSYEVCGNKTNVAAHRARQAGSTRTEQGRGTTAKRA
jgi:hypothetical protein